MTLLALLAVLAVAGVAVYGAVAAGGKPDFVLAVSPSSQSVTRPASGTVAVTFGLTFTRVNGMTDPVTLSLSSLPAGVTSSGIAPATVSPSGNSASLTLNVSSTASAGTDSFTVTAVGKNASQTHTVTLALVVNPAPAGDFSLSVAPAVQTVAQGDIAAYTVNVSRVGSFNGPVTLTASGTPGGSQVDPPVTVPSTATSAVVHVNTDTTTATGTFTISFTGTNGSLTHSASAALIVQKGAGQRFSISGTVASPLAPGVTEPLELTLTNPTNTDYTITGISVALEQATSTPACAASNFSVVQIPATAYPFTIPAHSSKTLSQLGIGRPTVSMLETGLNQDACQHAVIYLDYSGGATK